ncbi:MAG: hypothetical protein IJQ31_14790 [Thermoguttaceae bacterium]|nr:hypothetical protein [Thermoguttaceae bacterium]
MCLRANRRDQAAEGKWENRILQTRASSKWFHDQCFSAVRRWRECQHCHHRWVTIELNEIDEMTWVPAFGKEQIDLDHKNIF